MTAFERVLAEPASLSARRALLEAWKQQQEPRAEVLALQLRHAVHVQAKTAHTDEAKALKQQALEAARAAAPAWRAVLGEPVLEVTLHRGLPAEVTLTGEAFVAHGERLFSLAPLQHLTLLAPLGPLDALFASPLFARLTSLTLDGVETFGDAGAASLAGSAHAASLRWLSLRSSGVGDAGVEALAASAHLAKAVYVGLAGNAANPTPFVHDFGTDWGAGRPVLAVELEKKYGARPWLQVPRDPPNWPPDKDALAVTP